MYDMNAFQNTDASLFELVFHKNPMPMWFYDIATLQFVEVNQAAILMYGYTREEFLKMRVADVYYKNDLDVLEEIRAELPGPNTISRDFRHVLKNNTIRHVRVVSYPSDYHGHQARLVMVNDITESTLHIERFELIAKATHDAVWDWNLETDEIWWNASFFELFGYQPDDIGKTSASWKSRIHPEDNHRVLEGIYLAIENRESNWYDQYRFQRADGSYALIIDRGYTIFQNGKAIRMLGSMTDVTSTELLRREQEDTQHLLQTITSASPCALWMSDKNGAVNYVNQKWIEWNHATANDTPILEGWLNVIHPEDREHVRAAFAEANTNRSTYQVDYRLRLQDGSTRWVTASGTPRFQKDGTFIGFVGSATDITRQKHMEQQKDGFISTVSHELKTPITSIKGYEQLLSRSNAITDSKGQNFLNRMRVQINRLDNLIQELLDVSRIESGKLTFQPSEFEMNVLMAELANDLQLVFPSHRLILVENQSCKVVSDKNRIIQLITNLVDNAVKYSPGAGKVNIKLACSEAYLTVSVQDFGRGIAKEQQPYIFERFYQVNDVYQAPGLGIGLYVCKEIISRQNGRIWFDSSPGQGSTFTFELPRRID
jgi:PAS domain S-box-containing protein